MALRDSYDFDSLVNEAERLVLEELQSGLPGTPGICRCQDCVLDMAAFALNNVKSGVPGFPHGERVRKDCTP